MITADGHIVIASGRDTRGNEGCEIWLSQQFPVPRGDHAHDGGSSRITTHHVTVVHSSPTLLAITVVTRSLALFICSGHAPHQQHTAARISE
eukprot:3516191-Alexandrium_andersonii.AAC.1